MCLGFYVIGEVCETDDLSASYVIAQISAT
ncbi:hypothetical protein V6Z12_D11G332000 [Gossypium hirsutum]